MRISTGIDIVKISRITQLMKNESALERIFHKSELQDSRPEHLAGIFAAKEACFKALSLDSPKWLEVQITWNPNGKPNLNITGDLMKNVSSHDISISHDAGIATAVVVMLLK